MGDVPNELRRAGRITTAFLNALGMTEGYVDRLGDTLTPTIDVWERPEWAHLRGEHRYSRNVTSAAVVARFSSIQLINPAGSGQLIVVDRIDFPSGNPFNIELTGGGAPTGANIVTTRGESNDGRHALGGLQSILTLSSADTPAGVANVQWQMQAVTDRPPPPFILVESETLFLIAAAVNQAIAVNVSWRERSFFPTEVR